MRKTFLLFLIGSIMTIGMVGAEAETSLFRAPNPPEVTAPAADLPVLSRGNQAFAIDIYPGYNVVEFPDADVPGTWNIVGPVSGASQFFAGDFVGNDFTTLYVIDYGTNMLSSIDTATGAVTAVGSCTPSGGQIWTGASGAPDGTLYAVSVSSSLTDANLYTVDVGTGTATLLGAVTGQVGLIDIAYDVASGLFYAVDIVDDVLAVIDPGTLVSTSVGSLGISANYAQGMDFDDSTGVLYLASYSSTGQMRTANLSTGMTTLVGDFPSGAEVDCLAFATRGGPTSEGSINLTQDIYGCEDTVDIEVWDSDLASTGTVNVNLASTTNPTGITVALTEDGMDPGAFYGSATISETPAGGELGVADGDTLTGTYEDADFGGAGPMTVTDTAMVDCVSPVISNVMVTGVTGNSAVISWTTDEPANTIVRFGESTPPMMSYQDTTLVTNHSATLECLNSCTDYYFEVQSNDGAGNMTVDNNGGFYFMFTTFLRVDLLDETMDTDPGWTISGGSWAWGQPTGGGGYYGNPDPTTGYTGDNVYGYNLNGDYTNSMPEYHLDTVSMDCSAGTGVTLQFYQWLGVENNSWDHAYVRVSNDGGSSWNQVWANGSTTLEGGAWEYMEYDLSTWADGYSDVKVRWTMGVTDTSVIYCGWNIDDV
ncbi:hypothetical protein JW905_04020, partial [bacterium]|nr:hypothetical protein [candidate division CSSED10-310 bacterium]